MRPKDFKLHRLAFSLRDGLAVVCVLGLVLGAYRMGRTQGEEATRATIDMWVIESLNLRLRQISQDDSDWASLRKVVQNKSRAWENATPFRRERERWAAQAGQLE